MFALKPVARKTIIGYFNGVHRHRKDVFSSGEDSVYLVEGGHPNEMLDIPPEFTKWENYLASTGITLISLVGGFFVGRLNLALVKILPAAHQSVEISSRAFDQSRR